MLATTPPLRPTAHRIGTLAGHRDAVYALAGRPDSDRIFSGSADGMVVAWDSARPEADGELLARVENSVYALRELPGRGLLLLGHNFQGVQAIDLPSKTLAFATALPPVAIFDIVYSETRQRLYCALGDGTLAVLRGSDFRLEHLLRLSAKSLRCLALHEGRHELAVGSSDWKVYVLDLDSLQIKNSLSEATNSVFTLTYTPDGRHLLAAGRDAHLRRYDTTQDYALADSIVAHMYAINHLAFSGDGRYLASCSLDKSIKLWDPASLALLRVLDRARTAGHGTSVNKLVWPGNPHRLVSCSDDRSLAVWQVAVGSE
ncbi:WD40 repeat domain-containing protein [Hymenobacter baengnokdamensis]|uniref:WD40 repeat domain-containing protein n=1 Tax=Hymenobacter baengnokdamensis TaxID=2615203 RepID=UPI0012447EFD|nr:WD40 repeat domain-containing protein [Hymenobacter baengnokdamensis]